MNKTDPIPIGKLPLKYGTLPLEGCLALQAAVRMMSCQPIEDEPMISVSKRDGGLEIGQEQTG